MAVMEGMDRTRVPVTSWRLVRKLWAEMDREAESVEVGLCAREPELTLNTGVPDFLVTSESPSPSLESEENGPQEACQKQAGVCSPRPHRCNRSQHPPPQSRPLSPLPGRAAVAQLT